MWGLWVDGNLVASQWLRVEAVAEVVTPVEILKKVAIPLVVSAIGVLLMLESVWNVEKWQAACGGVAVVGWIDGGC